MSGQIVIYPQVPLRPAPGALSQRDQEGRTIDENVEQTLDRYLAEINRVKTGERPQPITEINFTGYSVNNTMLHTLLEAIKDSPVSDTLETLSLESAGITFTPRLRDFPKLVQLFFGYTEISLASAIVLNTENKILGQPPFEQKTNYPHSRSPAPGEKVFLNYEFVDEDLSRVDEEKLTEEMLIKHFAGILRYQYGNTSRQDVARASMEYFISVFEHTSLANNPEAMANLSLLRAYQENTLENQLEAGGNEYLRPPVRRRLVL